MKIILKVSNSVIYAKFLTSFFLLFFLLFYFLFFRIIVTDWACIQLHELLGGGGGVCLALSVIFRKIKRANRCCVGAEKCTRARLQTVHLMVSVANVVSVLCILIEVLSGAHAERRKGLNDFKSLHFYWSFPG